MATSNLGLTTLATTDQLSAFPTVFNGNMESIDSAFTPRFYVARGQIGGDSSGTAVYTGVAVICVIGKTAIIDFSMYCTTQNTSTSLFEYGLSADRIKTLSDCPYTITPIPNASPVIWRGGDYTWIPYAKEMYGAIVSKSSSGSYWVPGRIYDTSGAFGLWPANYFSTGETIKGVCFGTIS